MEFVTSERGKKHLCLDGYRYCEKTNLRTVSLNGNVHLEIAEQWVIWTNSKNSPLKPSMLIYRAPQKLKLRNLLTKFEKKPQTLVTLPDRLSSTPKLTCLFMQRLQYRNPQHLFGV